MDRIIRIAEAFALSLLAAGALQQGLMAAAQLEGPPSALPPLAGLIVVICAVFAVAVWRKAGIGRAALALLAVMIAVGAGAIVVGLADRSPGIGGDILYGLAQLLDLYFLLPAAAALPIHWLLLRGVREGRPMAGEPRYRELERRGEEIYDEMYRGGSALGLLSEVKQCFYAAIAAAESEGLPEEARRLEARLDHIVTVYRRQFT